MSHPEKFAERFNRLTAGISLGELAFVTGLSENAIRNIKNGETQQMYLGVALKLCRRLNVSPWELAGEPEPPIPGAEPLAAEIAQHSADAIEALAIEIRTLKHRVDTLEKARKA